MIWLLAGGVLQAGPGPNYRYGECWWREYGEDDATALLLHFSDSKTPGKFGGACTGRYETTVPLKQEGQSVECWFKVDALPKQPACILSVADDESRILLRPDGRLELKLKQPHGIPSKKLAPDQLAEINARNADIIAPTPVKLGEWTHVVAYNSRHVVQGAGAPFDATLKINGGDVAHYLSEVNNSYKFLGWRSARVIVGNNVAGDQQFAGLIDEVRLLTDYREFYEVESLPWRDATAKRTLQFGQPFFLENADVVHASCDDGPSDGIRGHGWLIDGASAFPHIALKEMKTDSGALEFWLRPVNWDNFTGYWSHSPPGQRDLSVVRLTGGGKLFLEVRLPRAHDLEHPRPVIDPGHWNHYVVNWDTQHAKASVFLNGKWLLAVKLDRAVGALDTAEFGVNDKVTIHHPGTGATLDNPDAPAGDRPQIEVDEIVGYRTALLETEIKQAYLRWQKPLEPLPLFNSVVEYKYSINKLEVRIKPQLPADTPAATARVSANAFGPAVTGPIGTDGVARIAFQLTTPIAPGKYQLQVELLDAAGKPLAKGVQDWERIAEPWAGNRCGILDKTPAPWTPIKVTGKTVETRMTRYELSPDGLPAQIYAAGEPLLAAPIQLLEDGHPLTGKIIEQAPSRDVEATWRAEFGGRLTMDCRVEYDGLIRYEFRATGRVGVLAFVVPVKADRVTHWLTNAAGHSDCVTGLAGDGEFLKPATFGFFNQIDLHDRTRGLFWFADNAAGWIQSKDVPAQTVTRSGAVTTLRCNLAADAGEIAKPIVFGILPHPARPMPEKYRLYERSDELSIFDAFKPWPMDPRTHSMQLYPAPDPEIKGSTEPSWAYAERCIPAMKHAKPVGYRTMYLSRFWFSCRAGAYDNWEWRSGPTQQATLTPRFVDYLCWEMNEWIGRGIFNAIYLDECYSCPTKNVAAGHAVVLPDGSVQAGDTLWGFREMMKRWRGIFIQHGLEPVMTGHHTGSFIYPGLVFCDGDLDGEGRPMITARSKDFIDAVPLHRLETIQNGAMWGITPFYMACIWELGLEKRDSNPHKRWAWRMGRDVVAALAHYETAYAYTPQEVVRPYWQDVQRWGAGDPRVPFHPYWSNATGLQVAGQGADVLVSYYQQPGKILLIASNRTGAPREIRVKLNRAALGLPANAVVKQWDSTYEPAAGEDLLTTKDLPKVSDKPKDDFQLEEPKAPVAVQKLEGDVLVLPTRAKDFRMVSVETP